MTRNFAGTLTALVLLMVTGCSGGGGSTPAGGSVDGSKVLACEVTDTGGADDKGFNQNAYKGITDAEAQFGSKGELLESKSDADYAPNIDASTVAAFIIDATTGALAPIAGPPAATGSSPLGITLSR